MVFFYENGKVLETGYYRDGKKSGEWIVYDTLGNIIEVMNYFNGKLDGEYIFTFIMVM